MPKLSSKEILSCTTVLGRLEPGFLPIEIFSQIARLVRLPTVDVIPVRWERSTLQIGILQRDAKDLWWGSGWHLPGTILQSRDTLETAFRRLLEEEILVQHSDPPVFQGFVLHQTKRGAEIVLLHSLEHCVLHHASKIQWVPVDTLPVTFVPSEKTVVEKLKQSLGIIPLASPGLASYRDGEASEELR